MMSPATPGSFGHGRWLLLVAAAALLFGEYLVLSVWLDAAAAAARGGLWRVMARLGAVGPIIVTTAAAWFMVFRLGAAGADTAEPTASFGAEHPSRGDPRPVARAPWLVAHGVSFATLVWVSISMFGSSGAPQGPAIVWLAAWCALAMLVFLSALLGTLGGARWLRVLPKDLRVAGPLGLLAWLAGLASAATWAHWSWLTLEPVAHVLSWCLPARSVALPGKSLLRIDHLILSVSPGCGGHEGFGLLVVLMAGYLYAARKDLPSRGAWLTLPVGLLLVWTANVVRFAAVGYLGVLFEPRVAVAVFHSKATWVLYCGLAVGAGALTRRALMRRRRSAR